MEWTTYLLIGVVVLLALVAVLAARRRRDRSLEPVRLGPAWAPPGGRDARDDGAPPASEVLRDDGRVPTLSARTGVDEETVATVLVAYDELLAVLGVARLPAGHRYRVYDPYDPPVVGRDAANRPIADPVRVARDVERHTGVREATARQVLDALLQSDVPGAGES